MNNISIRFTRTDQLCVSVIINTHTFSGLLITGMEYSYSYLYSYLLEYFFSVLSCTLYLANFMSTCNRTYLSTVTKNPVLMSTLRVPLSTFF